MNKSLFPAVFVTALCAACAQQPKDGFTLTGSAEGLDGQYVFLSYMNDTVPVTDSALVEGGAFRFEGKLKVPIRVGIYPKLPMQQLDPKHYYSPFIESADMTLTIDTADWSKSRLEGSATQLAVDSLEEQQRAIMAEAEAIEKAIAAETDHEKQNELREQLEPFQTRVRKLSLAFIANHPSSYASPDMLRSYSGYLTYEELKGLYDGLSPEVQQVASAREVADELETLGRVQPGQPAPLFEATDVNGKPFRLADLKGKYVVIDFWASWCVPCRKSNPHMKEMYAKYHDKGLEYVYVGDNDNSPEDWRKAIKEDGLEEFHHVLRGMKMSRENGEWKFDRTNDISDKYAIHFLPTKYLIDPDGNIVGKMESDELEAKFKEIFGD
ncbi:TlpA disulfide reductase family protein [Bacteroides sp. Marseille-P3684]|uniref:TlpA disulfide reductase family protein n=1 Tax=Bacteroides sp. Marseille-P3684 TaxID=2086579 RepID=UPI000D0B05AA|nr:TlpA disulfide reductase family protein [Bacteroides sp. Marseille-P3684]